VNGDGFGNDHEIIEEFDYGYGNGYENSYGDSQSYDVSAEAQLF